MKCLILCITLIFAAATAVADDGLLQSKNVSKTSDLDTEHTSLRQLLFYVNAQTSDGVLITETADGAILYKDREEVLLAVEGFEAERIYARPLIAMYEDGHVTIPPDSGGFYGHGERDMWAALSLDDGATWKRTNISRSADKSSINLKVYKNKKKFDWVPYPGDVFRNFTTSAGNRVLAVWASRYCSGGNPNFAMLQSEIDTLFNDETVTDTINLGAAEDCADIRPVDENGDAIDPGLEDLAACRYFGDAAGVSGSQGIKDFAEEGYESVGEVPYACIWAARGTLEPVDELGNYDPEGVYHAMVWRQAERLSSGRRDAHRMETACVQGAGCVVTWQEDPEGLRPGKGEGPGEGWSGAIAHHKTDIWYAFIDWNHFDLVKTVESDAEGNVISTDIQTLGEYDFLNEGIPPVGVPFSIPVRLTDNALCQLDADGDTVDADGNLVDDPYCFIDYDADGSMDFCADYRVYSITVPDEDGQATDHEVNMCVAEDGRLMRGNTASTRARTNLRGYDPDGDGITDRAWVVLAYEESKGLGDEEDIDVDNEVDKVDMGKNIWYHTFDMFQPELVSQGMILNQPAIYPVVPVDDINGSLGAFDLVADTENDASTYTGWSETEVDFYTIVPDPVYADPEVIDTPIETTLYQMEIARRYSQITQSPAAIAASSEGTAAVLMFKQGIIRQGGPADVFARRMTVDPSTFKPGEDNPFDYYNMDCEDGAWLFRTDLGQSANPRYVKGLCLSTPQNLSGAVLVACVDGAEDPASCEPLEFPYDTLFADIDKSLYDEMDEGSIPKMTEWRQCQEGQSFSVIGYGDSTVNSSFTCVNGSGADINNLNDQAWETPWDVAKGHRGYMKGDFVVVLYAWSPNWEANAGGKDNYNLYARRSFDGGLTWTTSAALDDTGTTHCEWYGLPGGDTEEPACFTYGSGEPEQARNLSQLIGSSLTVLDPRFAATAPSIPDCLLWTTGAFEGLCAETTEVQTYLYADDQTDKSRFFVTYEIGDTSAVADGGEAEPLDMFYARAVGFGDFYEVADTIPEDNPDGIADIVPILDGEGKWVFESFDKLEWHGPHAAEASLKSNPAGTLFYAIWNEWDAENSDATVRRTIELELDHEIDPVTLPSGGDISGGGDDPPNCPPKSNKPGCR